MRTQKVHNFASGAVAYAEKNQLWWRTVHQTALVKVPVFRNDDKAIRLSEGPDSSVATPHESMLLYVS